MKNLFYLLFFTFQFSFAETSKDSIIAKRFNEFNTNYKDFIIVGKSIYAITKGDSLMEINIEKNSQKLLKTNIVAIAKNSQDKLLIARIDGQIFKLNKKSKLTKIDYTEGKVFKIIVDKKDNPIIVSDKSVYYKKQHYYPKLDSPMCQKLARYRTSKRILAAADVYYLDSNNLLWFGYDAGEWGGDVCFFDLNRKILFDVDVLDIEVPNENYFDGETDKWNPRTRSKTKTEQLRDYPDKVKVIDADTILKFPTNLYISNIKGITQNEKGDYYFATSLMHFFVTSELTKKIKTSEKYFYKEIDISDVLDHKIYEEKIEKYLNSKGEISMLTVPSWKESLEYLGGITYNIFDKQIYYYTNNGFFKLIEKENEYSKEFFFKPLISWINGMEHSVGYQMNVKKFEFISENELVFMTSSNGIGFYDGKTVKYYQ